MSRGRRHDPAPEDMTKRYLEAKETAIRIRRREAAKNPRREDVRIEDPYYDASARRLEERSWQAQVCPTCFLAMPCDCGE